MREKIMHYIKKYFRRKYLFWRYNHNYKSGKPIYLNRTDRGFGFTFRVAIDSLSEYTPILVPTNITRNRVAYEICKAGQLGLGPTLTEKYAYDNLVITPNTNLRGKKIPFILVDNSCTEKDVSNFLNNNPMIRIKNGFITKVFR